MRLQGLSDSALELAVHMGVSRGWCGIPPGEAEWGTMALLANGDRGRKARNELVVLLLYLAKESE
jgi:hypothetical protein